MNEHELQSAVIQWARMSAGMYPCLAWLHSIPNGATFDDNRTVAIIRAKKMKAEGLTPGVSDLFLPWAARGYHGFYIECKAPGKIGSVRTGQADFMKYAEQAGYLCQVHDSVDDIIEAITWYLNESA